MERVHDPESAVPVRASKPDHPPRWSQRIVGRSAAIRGVVEMAGKVACSASPVLVVGESGTGKELIARCVHDSSPRCGGRFLPVNVSAIPADLFESIFFGHEKGSYTNATEKSEGVFRAANGGTLFLDEIGALPVALQPKLLRTLESSEILPVGAHRPIKVDVRVVAAANQDLEAMVRTGAFRQDLYYRLTVLTIRIPPLRDRPEDIPLLVDHYIGHYAGVHGRPVRGLDADAMGLLVHNEWPGNVRELAHVLERAMLLVETEQIGMRDIASGIGINAPSIRGTLDEEVANFKRRCIIAALSACDGNRRVAAQNLGISPATLFRYLNEFGLAHYYPGPDETAATLNKESL